MAKNIWRTRGGGVGLENVRLSDESAEVAVVVAGYIGLKMSERSNCDDCQCSPLIRFTAREETQVKNFSIPPVAWMNGIMIFFQFWQLVEIDDTEHIDIFQGLIESQHPFECNECDYKAARSHHLKTHKLTHMREKKFVCGYCPKKCTTRSALIVHVSTTPYTFQQPRQQQLMRQVISTIIF